jgi:hypothetical protein
LSERSFLEAVENKSKFKIEICLRRGEIAYLPAGRQVLSTVALYEHFLIKAA